MKPDPNQIVWRAYYEDGTELWQFNPSTDQASTYADVDRAQLSAFALYRGCQPLVMVDFRDDSGGDPEIGPKRLIWRIRNSLSTDGNSVKIHLVGWQRKIRGRNVQSICFVAENGTVVLGGQWQDKLPLRHAIQPTAFETDLIE